MIAGRLHLLPFYFLIYELYIWPNFKHMLIMSSICNADSGFGLQVKECSNKRNLVMGQL